MTLAEELEIAKSRIMAEINFIDDDPSYRSGLKFALKIIEEECQSKVLASVTMPDDPDPMERSSGSAKMESRGEIRYSSNDGSEPSRFQTLEE